MGMEMSGTRFDDRQLIGAWSGLQESAMNSAGSAAEVWMRSVLAIHQNLAAFWAERVRQDLTLMQQAMACRTPAEFVDLQQKFGERALAAYRDEAERVNEMAGGCLCDMAGKMRGAEPGTAPKSQPKT